MQTKNNGSNWGFAQYVNDIFSSIFGLFIYAGKTAIHIKMEINTKTTWPIAVVNRLYSYNYIEGQFLSNKTNLNPKNKTFHRL